MILLSLVVVFLYTSLHLSLHQDLEERLVHEVREFSSKSGNWNRFDLEKDKTQLQTYRTDSVYGTYVRLLSREGIVVDQSPNFVEHSIFAPRIPVNVTNTSFDHVWDQLPAITLMSPRLSETGSQSGWVEITRWESPIHNELHRLRWLLGLGTVFGVALAFAGGQWLAKRALSPVSALNDAANSIRGQGLSARLPTDFGVRDELSDLAETFNAMLDRLDASFDRERRFRADAAHELLTPMSAILSEADVALRLPRDNSTLQKSIKRVRSHTLRMKRTVKSLLFLSRVEATELDQAVELDLSELTSQQIEQSLPSANAKKIDFVVRVKPGIGVVMDEIHARTILDNLIDNAVKYTPAGGTVTITLQEESHEAVLTVADTGVGFDQEESSLLFDRFYRANAPAKNDIHGNGLGLSIVRAAIHVYGGSVNAHSEGPGMGSSFEVRMPYNGFTQILRTDKLGTYWPV